MKSTKLLVAALHFAIGFSWGVAFLGAVFGVIYFYFLGFFTASGLGAAAGLILVLIFHLTLALIKKHNF